MIAGRVYGFWKNQYLKEFVSGEVWDSCVRVAYWEAYSTSNVAGMPVQVVGGLPPAV